MSKCDSGTTITRVTKHSPIGYKAHSTKMEYMPGFLQVAKNPILGRPWIEKNIKYYYSTKGCCIY